jgi:hypothetical protein
VYVHVESPEPVDLQRATGDRHVPFETVCTSPCDTQVPTDGRYRISGDAVRSTRTFTFASGVQREDMVVKPASSTGFSAGIALVSAGGISITIGMFSLLVAGLADGPSQGDGGHPVAVGLMLGGLLAVAGGIVFIVGNARTTVSHTVTTAPPAPAKPPENPERIILLPTRSGIALEKALPVPMSVPIFAFDF